MKTIFFCGNNLYGQFLNTKNDASQSIIRKFTKISSEKSTVDLLFFNMSLTYNILIARPNQFIIRGFVNGEPMNNFNVNFNVKTINGIASNENHVLILDNKGVVWKLNLEDGVDVPSIITNFIDTEINEENSDNVNDYVAEISCSNHANLAISKKGVLYSIPSRIETDFVVQKAACGREHTILLSDNGRVYTWGCGTRGQLGHGDLEDASEPRLVNALDGINIVRIAAGGWHSAAVSRDGDLYTWGWNANGQLGFLIKNFSVLATPRPVDFEQDIEVRLIDVACGTRHTVALRDTGILYGCGSNKYGQLANDINDDVCQMMPLHTNNKLSIKNVQILCGSYSTAYILN